MENNLENKAKFFALYFGQPVLREKGKRQVNHYNVGYLDEGMPDHWLELKPLSSITNEDAAYLAQRFNVSIGSHFLDDYNSFEEYKKTFTNFSESKDDYCHCLEFFDYLRLKGYALPYMGLSIEKQIEYNWIKLIDNGK